MAHADQLMIKEVRPRLVFERLFEGHDANRAERDALRRSILDYVREDSQSLTNRLGADDRRRLDDYLTSLRDLEQRIARVASFPRLEKPELAPIFPTATKDAGAPKGLDMLREIRSKISIPVVAIGGVTSVNVRSVLEAGADAVAVASALLEGNIGSNAKMFLDIMRLYTQ